MEFVKLIPINRICPCCGNGNYMRIISGKYVGELNVKCINCNSYYNYDELIKRDNSKPLNGADGGDTVELKPCPFCGVEVRIIFRSASMMFMVYHKDDGNACYLAAPFKIPVAKAHSFKEAAEAWNRRANE